MLIIQFPCKKSLHEKRIEKINKQNELKKIKNNVIKNVVISLVIIILSFKIEPILIKIFVILIGLSVILTAYILYKLTLQKYDNRFYTKIYDNKIEHSQVSFFKSIQQIVNIDYSNIKKSCQNNIGNLQLFLINNKNVQIEIVLKNGLKSKKVLNDSNLLLKFQNQDAKYYLINNMSDKIKYIKTTEKGREL